MTHTQTPQHMHKLLNPRMLRPPFAVCLPICTQTQITRRACSPASDGEKKQTKTVNLLIFPPAAPQRWTEQTQNRWRRRQTTLMPDFPSFCRVSSLLSLVTVAMEDKQKPRSPLKTPAGLIESHLRNLLPVSWRTQAAQTDYSCINHHHKQLCFSGCSELKTWGCAEVFKYPVTFCSCSPDPLKVVQRRLGTFLWISPPEKLQDRKNEGICSDVTQLEERCIVLWQNVLL